MLRGRIKGTERMGGYLSSRSNGKGPLPGDVDNIGCKERIVVRQKKKLSESFPWYLTWGNRGTLPGLLGDCQWGLSNYMPTPWRPGLAPLPIKMRKWRPRVNGAKTGNPCTGTDAASIFPKKTGGKRVVIFWRGWKNSVNFLVAGASRDNMMLRNPDNPDYRTETREIMVVIINSPLPFLEREKENKDKSSQKLGLMWGLEGAV